MPEMCSLRERVQYINICTVSIVHCKYLLMYEKKVELSQSERYFVVSNKHFEGNLQNDKNNVIARIEYSLELV
jgi:hypothetical protein